MENTTVTENNIVATDRKAKDSKTAEQSRSYRIAHLKDEVLRLTPHQIKTAKYSEVISILNLDTCDNDYIRIQELTKGIRISREQLVSMVDEKRDIDEKFEDMIISDMLTLITREILATPVLSEQFISIYSKKYNEGFQVAQSIIKNGNEGMGKKMKDLDLGELCFCRFLLFNSPCVLKGTGWDNEIRLALKVRAVGTEDIFTSNYQSYFEELKEITFSETGESVLFSKEFDKFLSKRKREIAKLLGVKVHEVSGTISEEMDFPDLGHLSISQIVRYVSEFVALENNGSEFWVNYYSCHYEDIDDYYIPDTDSIIRNYYMVRVMEMYYRYKDNWDDFTKGDLFKGWEINPARDLQGICYMYCIDTIYKMFSKMMKEYYRIFPWNKFGFMNAKTQYEQMENDLNKIIEEQKKEIDSLNKQISSLKE